MPWHIETANAECTSGYAVVKDSNGEVEGCHRTRREALAQLAALNIAEEQNRAAGADETLIVDIDGTLLRNGVEPIDRTIAYVNDHYPDYRIAIVTGRPVSRRAETIRALRAARVLYDALYMRPETEDTIAHKARTAAELLRSGEVEKAIENDPDARAAYAELGIEAVSPEQLEEEDSDEMRAETYTPTSGMVAEARRGLEWRRAFNRGGTEIGVARARSIVNRQNLPLDTVQRMASYFARHEVDKQGQGFSPGEPGYPSAGRIAWALWGGDPGKTWAEQIIESTTRQDA